MKFLLLVLVTFSFVAAHADIFGNNHYALTWLAYEPSSINRAIGGDAVGVVDIWHHNPLTSYSNPAIPAFHEGFSYGYTRIEIYHSIDSDNTYLDAALINIAYNGISFTLPVPNEDNNFGISIDYGSQDIYDQGHITGTFHPYDTCSLFGVAINVPELMRKQGKTSPILNHFDLAIGINEVAVKSVILAQEYNPEVYKDGAKAWCTDIGAIAKYTYKYKDLAQFEAVYGISEFNLFDTKIKYGPGLISAPILSRTNNGLAFSVSIPASLLNNMAGSQLTFTENLVSFRYLTSLISDEYNAKVTGNGFEIGFLDTIFFRNGRYEDKHGSVKGNTRGYGFNLHYRDLFSLSYNEARAPLGLRDDVVYRNSTDYAFSCDFMALYKAVKQRRE